jgi:Carboxypeptidase regulatory-like domain
MKSYSPLIRCLLSNITLFALVFSLSSTLKAQDVATITGVITDQTGAVIPDVEVMLQNPQTGATYKTVSNTSGSYTLSQVKPGPGYKIEFTHEGFNAVVISGLYMNVDATRTQNAKLSIGASQQTVLVSAANQDVTLDTTDSTVGNSFQVQFLNELPVANRDSPAALFTQQPGVTLDGAVTGARVDQTNVTLDGLDVNDNATGNFGAIVANAPVDSVQEFRGVTASPLAGAGAGGGGQFELVTRSGSNSFHGALVEYHRDTDLEANDWFNNNSGTPRPPLIRNQFGGNIGGPILKNKLFFFFDYNGRRDTLSNLVLRNVPTTAFRNGTLTYNNSSGTTSALSSAQVAALDPQGIGFSPALLSTINSRYPVANDLTGDTGDLLNTAGFRFNAPFPYKEDDYVQRVDYNLNSKMKIFGVGHFTKTVGTQNPIQFPGDPTTFPFLDNSYSWAVGHTWTISNTMVNQVSGGETFENYDFPDTFNPTGATQYTNVGGNPSGGAGILANFYASAINAQGRTYPIPVVRDDFSWDKGKHSITIGGSFKWDSPNSFAILNYNQPTIGLGGQTENLTVTTPGEPQLRPANIASDAASQNLYDEAFALALSPFTKITSTFNYNNQGVAFTQGSGLSEHYRYYEPEIYVGDTWKITPSLTLSYGLRYQLFTVPYEENGIQSRSSLNTAPNTNVSFDQYFALRNAQSQAGQISNTSIPFIQYTLGGKANHALGYFNSNPTNFAPRFAFAYNPSFDRKTVFSGGAGIIYDHTVVNALQFQQSQASFLFQSANTVQPGSSDPYMSLKTDSRFGGLSSPPPPPSTPVVTAPFTPFVSGGVPNGLANEEGTSILDPNLKNPYSIQFNFGFQHEFPQGYILKTTYVGRLGRRLLAQADASQLIDFPDKTSGQMLSAAMGSLTTQLRQGVPATSVAAQPWFEDILPPGTGVASGFANNTQLVAAGAAPYPQRGDFADTIFLLAAFGLLPPNVGLASQFDVNDVYTNKGFSSYNGLLTTLHKNAGYGLQFDINYTWAHSIDNTSFIANNPAGGVSGTVGFICEAAHPRVCRGSSDFDVANYLSGNFIYNLPFGRGRSYFATAPLWVNEVIGGWALSGLPSWHTGNAYNAQSNAFVGGFSSDAPATIIGPIANLKTKIQGGKGVAPVAYSNQAAALAAVTGPTGFDIGSRNNLRGPGYFNMDLGIGKTFPVYRDSVHLKFRADAFNAFNHTNFNPPTKAADITASSGIPFGTITSDVLGSSGNANRVLQGALRLEF